MRPSKEKSQLYLAQWDLIDPAHATMLEPNFYGS